MYGSPLPFPLGCAKRVANAIPDLSMGAVAVGEAMGIDKAEEQVAEFELGEAQGIMCDAAAGTVSLTQAVS